MFLNAGAAFASANHPRTSYLLFLMIELLCGIYFPAMGRLRSKNITCITALSHNELVSCAVEYDRKYRSVSLTR